jgi:hypothetical protein
MDNGVEMVVIITEEDHENFETKCDVNFGFYIISSHTEVDFLSS